MQCGVCQHKQSTGRRILPSRPKEYLAGCAVTPPVPTMHRSAHHFCNSIYFLGARKAAEQLMITLTYYQECLSRWYNHLSAAAAAVTACNTIAATLVEGKLDGCSVVVLAISNCIVPIKNK